MALKLPLHRKSGNHVLSHRAGATNADNLALAGIVILDDISLYFPHYTPSTSNQKLMLGHIVSKAPTEKSFKKTSTYMKDVTTENNWIFELGVGDSIDIPIYVLVGFMRRDQFNQQIQNKDTF